MVVVFNWGHCGRVWLLYLTGVAMVVIVWLLYLTGVTVVVIVWLLYLTGVAVVVIVWLLYLTGVAVVVIIWLLYLTGVTVVVVFNWGHRGRDRMVVVFKTTCVMSAYHHKSCEIESWYTFLVKSLSVTCDMSVSAPVSSNNKNDCHDITEILLKMALSTITLTHTYFINMFSTMLKKIIFQIKIVKFKFK